MNFTEIMTTIGFTVLGAGFIYVQWRTGANTGVKVASEVIETYKVQVQQLREELQTEKQGRELDRHELKNELQELKLQLARMEGANTEKDIKIKEFTEIFQGKSPEQEQYMKDMREFTKGVASYMKDSAEIFAGMKTFMTRLNVQSQTNQTRNEAIDSGLAAA